MTPEALKLQIAKLNNKLANNNINHVLHLILSLLTGGLWLIVWAFIMIFHSSDNTIINKIHALEAQKLQLEREDKQRQADQAVEFQAREAEEANQNGTRS